MDPVRLPRAGRTPTTKFELGYRPDLDGVRGIAILLVMFYHLDAFPLANGGHIGVDLFFVLSGFLITSLLLTEWEMHRRIDIRAFYMRRALRLLPALYVMLVVLLFGLAFHASNLMADDATDWQAIPPGVISAFAYSSNWVIALRLDYLGPLTHTWTLAMEEQFYLIWPLALVCLMRTGASLGALATGLVVAAVAVAVWRFVLWSEIGMERAHYGPDARADALLLGCLVAVLAHDDRLTPLLRRMGTVTPAVCLCLLLFIGSTTDVRSAPVYLGLASVIDVAAAVCLAYVVSSARGRLHAFLSLKPCGNRTGVVWTLYLARSDILPPRRDDPCGMGGAVPALLRRCRGVVLPRGAPRAPLEGALQTAFRFCPCSR